MRLARALLRLAARLLEPRPGDRWDRGRSVVVDGLVALRERAEEMR